MLSLTPEDFGTLVAAHPDIPEIPGLVSGADAARLTGLTVEGFYKTLRNARVAAEGGRWREGMCPLPDAENPMRWRVDALVRWRATQSPQGGGHPFRSDYEELLKQARRLKEQAPGKVSIRYLMAELHIGYGWARTLYDDLYENGEGAAG